MGSGVLPETTVSKHSPPCHLQMPTNALSCKKQAICERDPEVPLCPVGQGSFKMDCFKVFMVRRVTDAVLSVFSPKASISDSMGVHKCIQYGQLACFLRHYEC